MRVRKPVLAIPTRKSALFSILPSVYPWLLPVIGRIPTTPSRENSFRLNRFMHCRRVSSRLEFSDGRTIMLRELPKPLISDTTAPLVWPVFSKDTLWRMSRLPAKTVYVSFLGKLKRSVSTVHGTSLITSVQTRNAFGRVRFAGARDSDTATAWGSSRTFGEMPRRTPMCARIPPRALRAPRPSPRSRAGCRRHSYAPLEGTLPRPSRVHS